MFNAESIFVIGGVMQELFEYMNNQMTLKYSEFKRYVYKTLPWEAQMFALIGPRGAGKTTLFLQRIHDEHEPGEALYVSLDHMYFSDHTLFEVADEFVKSGGKYLYVDEVHVYEHWSRELKNIYDCHPDLKVYFTGSSALNILDGEADLSRRAPVFKMQGLSFREYLNLVKNVPCPVYSLQEILQGKANVPGVAHPLPFFREYLRDGYYPFMTEIASNIRIEQIVNSTLQFDIPQIANLSVATGRKLKKLMVAIAESVPFKPNVVQLASRIGASRNSVDEYLTFLEDAGMIMRLRDGAGAFAGLGKVSKVYLDNCTLMNVLSAGAADIGCVRETFFFNQMRVNHRVCSSAASDFEVDGFTFEVGGRGKTGKQVAGLDDAYVVKDGIEYAAGNVIPLWCFGLNY
jgi:uncharacterized protein